MGHQPQVVADEPVPRGSVAVLQRRKGGLFLRRVQRARKAAALQPQRQVSNLPGRRLHKHRQNPKHTTTPWQGMREDGGKEAGKQLSFLGVYDNPQHFGFIRYALIIAENGAEGKGGKEETRKFC